MVLWGVTPLTLLGRWLTLMEIIIGVASTARVLLKVFLLNTSYQSALSAKSSNKSVLPGRNVLKLKVRKKNLRWHFLRDQEGEVVHCSTSMKPLIADYSHVLAVNILKPKKMALLL